ncbi:hypothetical protein C1O63_0777 [Dehalococcoides mccartyi]|nr:hypothetical protein C1O63_0777 [Dehalococcoides mccartyi]
MSQTALFYHPFNSLSTRLLKQLFFGQNAAKISIDKTEITN